MRDKPVRIIVKEPLVSGEAIVQSVTGEELTRVTMMGNKLLERIKILQECGCRDTQIWEKIIDGVRYRIDTSGDIDKIIIGTARTKVSKKEEKKNEIEAPDYVLLVELYKEGWGGAAGEPSGFAIFSRSGKGQGAGESNSEGETLSLSGILTNCCIENKIDPKDHAGNLTDRKGWVNYNVEKVVVQQARIDQGWCAYPGEVYLGWDVFPEVNENNCYNNVWTYEDVGGVEAQNGWNEEPIPGPPPEDMVSYTWGNIRPKSNFKQPPLSEDTFEFDHWEDIYLFYYMVRYPFILSTIFWPEEFNQVVESWNFWNESGFITTMDKESRFWMDSTDGMESLGVTGCPGYAEGWCFENSVGVLSVTDHSYTRKWGILWGSIPYSADDWSPGEYPYLSPPPPVTSQEHVQKTDVFRGWGAAGVHVRYTEEERVKYFIQFNFLYSDYSAVMLSWGVGQREEIPPEDFQDYEALTDRQKLLAQGNEDSFSGWHYDPWTGLWEVSEGSTSISNNPTSGFLVSGKDYLLSTVNMDTNTIDAVDYGIFSKENKGVEDRAIDSDDVIPIYTATLTNSANGKFQYFMFIDDLMYKTGWLDSIPGSDLTISRFTRVGKRSIKTEY